MRGLVILLSGCGRIGFTPQADAPVPDAPVTAACEQAWLTSPTFGAPDLLPSVNSTSDDIVPFLASNQLDLYFSSDRNGTDYDDYVASRASPTSPFGTPVLVAELASAGDEQGVTLSRDGLVAYFSTTREGQADIWRATRTRTDQPFANPSVVPALASPATEYNAILSYNERELYFAADGRPGSVGQTDIWRATRANAAADFGQPELVMELATPVDQASPSLIATGRVIVFTDRPGSSFDVFYATRASTDVPFDPPQPVPGINTGGTEYTPHLRPDGCELFFTTGNIRAVRLQ